MLVGPDRYLSGRFGEERLGVTVHLLDDGFQHVALFRDVDLLLADAADLTDRVLPAGRLREPISAARAADAVLTIDAGEERIEELRRALGVPTIFHLRRELGAVRWMSGRPPTSSRPRTLPSWPSPESLDRSGFSTILRRPAGTSPALSVSADHHRYDRDGRRADRTSGARGSGRSDRHDRKGCGPARSALARPAAVGGGPDDGDDRAAVVRASGSRIVFATRERLRPVAAGALGHAVR